MQAGLQCNMVKKQKVNQKEKEKVNPNPSPSVVGLPVATTQEPEYPAEGTPAATAPTEEGGVVQVGQVEQAELNEQIKEQQQQRDAVIERTTERSVHPVLGTVFQSNVVKYKNRKTEFLTLPKKLVEDELYPFKGTNKTLPVKITRAEDGRRLIIERL